jgi:putative solute:sodium symporter small subunit
MAQSIENDQQWGGDRSTGYWKRSVRLQLVLLAEPLHDVEIAGFPLSFWIAQNGAIFVFVILIFVFARRMDNLDHEYDVHDEDLSATMRDRLTKRADKKSGGAK